LFAFGSPGLGGDCHRLAKSFDSPSIATDVNPYAQNLFLDVSAVIVYAALRAAPHIESAGPPPALQ